MPTHFSLHTPEALLGRNDSKNPATTCQGITSSGRPCRRALASPSASPASRRGSSIPASQEGDVQTLAGSFCWQHKSQAQQSDREQMREVPNFKPLKGNRVNELLPVQERSSIDTLVHRLGIENVEQERKQSKQKSVDVVATISEPPRRQHEHGSGKRRTGTGRTPRAEENGFVQSEKPRPAMPKKKKKSGGFWASLCCMVSDDGDEYMEIVRHRKRVEEPERTHTAASLPPPRRSAPPTRKPPSQARIHQDFPSTPPPRPSPETRTSSTSQTTQLLLSLIPPTLSPQTTSLLLSELSKPLSPSEEEGYIYIFWLTPQNLSAPRPPETAARALLTPPSERPNHARRISDVMSEYSSSSAAEGTKGDSEGEGGEEKEVGKRTIKLKIGRANNVTRRMGEWRRQCGYELNLVRWYPYVSSSSASASASASPVPSPGPKSKHTPSPSPSWIQGGRVEYPDLSRPPARSPSLPRDRDGGGSEGRRRVSEPAAATTATVKKVAYVKRVERLVHLELADKRVKQKQCEACGREHREWFEVEASEAGVRGVDECVRRWVAWADREREEGM